MKICCSKYSDLDDKVIAKATELGLPLIGGTALEIWANYYNRSDVRKRSDNDIDVMADNELDTSIFQDWIQENINPDKVEVDVYLVKSHDFSKYIKSVNGVLVMSLPYLLWSKLIRGSKKDLIDCKWILSITQLSDEEIVSTLEDLGITAQEYELLQSLM